MIGRRMREVGQMKPVPAEKFLPSWWAGSAWSRWSCCLKKDSEASVFMVRELVFLDADNASGFCELGFVSVQGRGVDGRKLDGEVLVGSLGLSFLVLW